MNKTKSSMYNAITTILGSALSSILSIIATKFIISNYGSDFNGVVATVNQVMTVLLIIEGGFTLAVNVALFKHYVNKEQKEINEILAATKKVFTKIAYMFLVAGVLVSLIYPLFIKSQLDYITVFLIFMMVVFSTFFTLIFTTRYKVMFQTAQKEYKVSLIGMLTTNLMNLVTIGLVALKANMLVVRFSIMMFTILNGIILFMQFRKDFKECSFRKEKPNHEAIKGTKDLMIQKITSAIYNSTPLIFISTFVGTVFSSVYAVYNSVYNFARVVINAFIAAPVNGFGQLIVEKEKEYVYNKFKLYEFIVILGTFIITTPIMILLIPFVKLYSSGVTDVNYVNYAICYMMGTILILESIHIPSGNIINVSGNFKKAKDIQLITAIVLSVLLVIASLICGIEYGIYGILLGTILTNILLAYMEISFIHNKYFSQNIKGFCKVFFVNTLLSLGLLVGVKFVNISADSYLMLFVKAIPVGIITTLSFVIVNTALFKKYMLQLFELCKNMLLKRKI